MARVVEILDREKNETTKMYSVDAREVLKGNPKRFSVVGAKPAAPADPEAAPAAPDAEEATRGGDLGDAPKPAATDTLVPPVGGLADEPSSEVPKPTGSPSSEAPDPLA